MAETLLRAVEERTCRAEKSVLRSMAEQSGMEEQALAEMLAQARARQVGETAPEERKRLETADERIRSRLLLAEVKAVGAELGLLDADAALRLLGTDAASVAEDGAVSGVREALEALKQQKGYLFAPPARAAWAQRIGSGAPSAMSGVEEAFYRKNPTLRR